MKNQKENIIRSNKNRLVSLQKMLSNNLCLKCILSIICFLNANLAFSQIFEASNKIPDTIFYNISGGRQTIEIDRESAWQRDVD
jgi:hypothetical protein